MNKWLLIGCALVAIGLVSADLGLKVSITTLTSLRNAVRNGVKMITAANASFTVNATLDASGAVTALRLVVADLVVPVGNLLSGIQSATNNKTGPADDVVMNLTSLVTEAGTSVGMALTDAAALETVTKPSWYNALKGNLSSASSDFSDLSSALSDLGTLLTTASSAQYPYTANNITQLITAAAVNSVVTPINYILGNLTMVSTIISNIGKAKQASVALQVNANKTINTNLQALLPIMLAFNKTVNASSISVLKLSKAALTAINTSFVPVLAKSANYNNGDMTPLNTYLSGNSDNDATFQTTVNASAQTTQDTVYTTFNTELTNLINALSMGISNISTMASTNESKYASQCETKYASMYTQASVSVSRLDPCVSQPTPSITATVSAVGTQFTSMVLAAGATSVKLSSCTVTNGTCSVSYFTAIGTLNARVMLKYTAATDIYTGDQTTLTAGIDDCITAVSKDIQDVSGTIQDKFVSCLQTGK
ncbi:uncharacterized protein LOC129732432 [Wyeomyia smithii]|uniref:uncharacterized protein LOC129732432 n=1 Tax=Wyeomyia smithii TaxID=174621 RepID=UPI002467DCBA|nr:uncharacterized protein LOC129732432 [Wyeomyia smithii]